MGTKTIEKLLIGTGNRGKFREISAELNELGIDTVAPGDLDFELERPESGDSYHENARIKAQEAFEKGHLPSLADDSGLEVDALDGEPGVKSDRWAGAEASAEDKNRFLLEKLDGVPTNQRTARFVCVMVLFDESGERFKTRGSCEGRIAESPSGNEGFGYDPIFEVERADWRTFSSLSPESKRWISHRALALNEMISHLKEAKLLPEPNLQ